jgi:hypothetical protein
VKLVEMSVKNMNMTTAKNARMLVSNVQKHVKVLLN